MNHERPGFFGNQHPRRARRGLSQWLALAPLLITASAIASTALAQEVRIITREAQREGAELIEISDQTISIRTERGGVETIPLADCIGLINLAASAQPRDSAYAPQGLLVLSDGQRLPGSPILGPDAGADMLYWRHRLARIAVPLERIAWTAFRSGVQPPAAGEADAILLTNGDRAEGFITALRDPVEIEQDGRTTSIALDRVSAIRLITPPTAPAPGAKRLWFDDGTVLDVPAVRTGDEDGALYFVAPLGESSEGDYAMPLTRIIGVLFDIGALVPFAALSPHDVEGPIVRYEVPAPEADARERALGLRDVTLRGPLTARYSLPSGAARMAGTARILETSREWSDCELVIAIDGRELFRQRLNAERPRLEFDVPIEGAELSIEITEGALGPVGDYVVLEGAMIIIDG